MLSLEELLKGISEKTGKDENEVRELIKEKQAELSDLVSEEGAAYIVGRELGLDLRREGRRNLRIANIMPDMKSVDVTAKVTAIFEPKEFEKNGKKGMVASVVLSDDTGTIRLPLWNDEVKALATSGIRKGDIVEISGAWAKKDSYRDGAELRLGTRGTIKKIGESDPEEMADSTSEKGGYREAGRLQVKDLTPGISSSVRGCLVQVYKKKPYYETCPNCGKRVQEKDGSFSCAEHGTVKPAHSLLLSGVIDDGTGNVRAVFFRESAEKIFGKAADAVRSEFMERGFDRFWEGFSATGKEFVVEGRIKVSDFSKEMEMMANSVSQVDARKEAEAILNELGM